MPDIDPEEVIRPGQKACIGVLDSVHGNVISLLTIFQEGVDNMLNRNLFRAFLVGALLVLPVGSANADYSGLCAEEFNTLELKIVEAKFFGARAETNRTNLLAKLDAAAAKLVQSKPSDAIDKLQSISDTATDLANATKPKLDADDATLINTSAGAAIQCVATNY